MSEVLYDPVTFISFMLSMFEFTEQIMPEVNPWTAVIWPEDVHDVAAIAVILAHAGNVYAKYATDGHAEQYLRRRSLRRTRI